MFRQSEDLAKAAIEANPNEFSAHKALSVVYGKLAGQEGLSEKVRLSRLVKESAEKALVSVSFYYEAPSTPRPRCLFCGASAVSVVWRAYRVGQRPAASYVAIFCDGHCSGPLRRLEVRTRLLRIAP